MPIYLPTINRRQFLQHALMAGAGLAVGRSAWAEAKPINPHSWALMADLHIPADRTKIRRGVSSTDNLAAVAKELSALATLPAAALVAGDCAFLQGESADYAALAELLQPIRSAPIPIHLVPGNHDDRDHLAAAFPKSDSTPAAVDGKRCSLVSTERANWLLLDSLSKTNVTSGQLGAAQLDWLGRTLDAHPGKPVIVVAHHDLDDGKHKGVLLETAAFLEALAPRKQVKAYIFGHTHSWNVAQHESGIHLINLPPVAWTFAEGKPSGWVLATLQPDGLRLQLNCLDHQHPSHGQLLELKWRPA